MSYLDIPRICIGGRFFTDPSTIDNDPHHYDEDVVNPSPWQNPNGKHEFKLVGCVVRSAIDATGANLADSALIGATVVSCDTPSAAKIADLDVYQQGVSSIYGLQITLQLNDSTSLVGLVDTPSLNGVQFNMVLPKRGWGKFDGYGTGSYGGDSNARGVFQSVLRVANSSWPTTASPVLNQLRDLTASEGDDYLLSFKFTVDGYINNPVDPNNLYGRFTGAIGPYFPPEPPTGAGDRWLVAQAPPDVVAGSGGKVLPWYQPAFYSCPFKVDARRKVLTIDLVNSLSTVEIGGTFVDVGTITAVAGNTAKTVIGTVPFSEGVYANQAGICQLPLTDAQVDALSNEPLQLTISGSTLGDQEPFSEDPAGLLITAVDRVLRVPGEPGSQVTARVYAARWGQPAANLSLAVNVVPVHGTTPNATVPRDNPGDTPQAIGAVSAQITPTNAAGFATITVTVQSDPGSRTPQLDGQLYFLYPYAVEDDPTISKVNQERLISCLAWSAYPVNQTPTWEEVRAILLPYVKLFPYMKQQIDLSDQGSFTIFAKNPPFFTFLPDKDFKILDRITGGMIPYVLNLPPAHPKYMPVTRDLSPNRIKTILYYIQNTCFPATNP